MAPWSYCKVNVFWIAPKKAYFQKYQKYSTFFLGSPNDKILKDCVIVWFSNMFS